MSCRRFISAMSRKPAAACTTWNSTSFPTRRIRANRRVTHSRFASGAPDLPGAPYLFRSLDDQAHLRCLRLTRDLITMHGARKATLRRQTELVKRQHFSCLVDFSLQRVLGLELAKLGRDQAQNDGLPRRHEAQRRKIARAGIVVFEEIPVDLELVEQHLRHRLVAALGHPRALEVAPAQGNAERPAGGAFRGRA